MRELKEGFTGFISLGREVEHEGQKVRPNTTTSIAIGKVDNIEENNNNNLKCTIKVSTAEHGFSGYLNDNTPVAKILREAKEKDATVAVRVERKRKKNVDPTADIKELTKSMDIARKNIVWIVAGVYNFGANEWILTDDSISNPKEDPEDAVRLIETAPYSTQNFFESNDTPKIQTTDLDWKANHLLTMYTYATDHLIEHEINMNIQQTKVLATLMLKAVDELQKRIKEIDQPNYNDYSHTKARGALFSWMRLNPLSQEIISQKGGFKEWISKFLEEYTEIWSWAIQEAHKER